MSSIVSRLVCDCGRQGATSLARTTTKCPGFKFADYELKGVPVRLVLGARDLENGTVEVMRRDTLEKETLPLEGIAQKEKELLDDIQKAIFEKARTYRDAHIYECENYYEFKERIKDGGF